MKFLAKSLLITNLCLFSLFVKADGYDIETIKSSISGDTIEQLSTTYKEAVEQVKSHYDALDTKILASVDKDVENNIKTASSTRKTADDYYKTKELDEDEIAKAKENVENAEKNYEDAKANQQSTANKMLTAKALRLWAVVLWN
ncbi:MAG: hypothetical protein MJ158_02105 [Alphaproteobacteria bacterium]|nr:hypothetical protein [Alphaproteobacteria bacterium]